MILLFFFFKCIQLNFLSNENEMIPPFELETGSINTISAQHITYIIYSADIIIYSGLLLGREISILDKNSEMARVTVFVCTQSK